MTPSIARVRLQRLVAVAVLFSSHAEAWLAGRDDDKRFDCFSKFAFALVLDGLPEKDLAVAQRRQRRKNVYPV